MKCQPIVSNKEISFKVARKKLNENTEPGEEPNKNTGFKIIYNGDSFEYSKLPPKGGILKKKQ